MYNPSVVDYSYQKQAANEIFKMSISEQFKSVILAASPSSGKSTIIIDILNKFFKLNPSFRAVIFTQNLNNLKDQMLEGFTEGFEIPNFTFGVIGQDVQVQVGAMASAGKVYGNIDIVVFDEAHTYYLENMAENAIKALSSKYVIGMTGTPSYFNEVNKKSKIFGIHYISAEELVDLGVFSNVLVDVANGEDLESRLNNSLQKATSHGMDISKLIITTKDQMDANLVGYLMSKMGRKVAVSTSTSDPDNQRLGGYKQGKYDVLVVVQKAALGFSDLKTTGLIDLRTSSDIDCRSQIFARVLRKHPNNIKKFYISAVTKKNHNKEIKMLQQTIGLMERKNFINYVK